MRSRLPSVVLLSAGVICSAAMPVAAQLATRSTGTQPVDTASRPALADATAFEARMTIGPLLSLPGDDPARPTATVQGPVWDGINEGLWFIPGDPSVAMNTPATAFLVDPATGKTKRKIDVPGGALLDHDGVGLWLAVARPGDNGSRKLVCQRIRTAPDPRGGQMERNWRLPQDLPEQIDPTTFRASQTQPAASVYSLFDAVSNHGQSWNVVRIFFDAGIESQYRQSMDGYTPRGVAVGGGYLWVCSDSLQRIGLLTPTSGTGEGVPDDHLLGQRQIAVLAGDNAGITGQLAWDGQRLWSLTSIEHRVQVALRRSEDGHQASAAIDPPQIVSIDMGYTRRPDTDARYRKALAFERANGTRQTLPLFEAIYTDDASAVEIRNHVAWALATRPEEPFHNLDRALDLVNQALAWQPWNPEFWDSLAEIYWRKGDADLAVRLESKAINLNPHKTFYWEQLAKFRAGPAGRSAPPPSYDVAPRRARHRSASE